MMRLRVLGRVGFGAIAALSIPSALSAQSSQSQNVGNPDATAQGDVAVTIYNNDLALVQDVRQLNIAQGKSRVAFPDVSSRIMPETLSFSAPNDDHRAKFRL